MYKMEVNKGLTGEKILQCRKCIGEKRVLIKGNDVIILTVFPWNRKVSDTKGCISEITITLYPRKTYVHRKKGQVL